MIRVVKDAAAGAVLLCAVGAAAAGLMVFLRRELWQAAWGILTSPFALLGFVLSLGAALAFILLGAPGGCGTVWNACGKNDWERAGGRAPVAVCPETGTARL